MIKTLALFTGAALALGASAAVAQPATLLGVYGKWTALSTGAGSGMTCFVRSEPTALRPASVKRDKAKTYLLVSDWPSRRIKGEPQIVYGYQVKEGGAGALGVGGDKFSFFIRNTGKDGNGWLTSLTENQRLVDAMRGGVSAVASGTNPKGVKTIDTYSLQGFGEALDKAHAACQM